MTQLSLEFLRWLNGVQINQHILSPTCRPHCQALTSACPAHSCFRLQLKEINVLLCSNLQGPTEAFKMASDFNTLPRSRGWNFPVQHVLHDIPQVACLGLLTCRCICLKLHLSWWTNHLTSGLSEICRSPCLQQAWKVFNVQTVCHLSFKRLYMQA